MAIDSWLLEASLLDPAGAPALRFYRWSRPTLSLGYHQRSLPPHWQQLAEVGRIDLVRRPSGGRAVLHGGDLTYALIWPAAAPFRRHAYGLACAWLCRAFADLGLPLRFGRRAPSRDRASCFATSTAADLVHPQGGKRIGSAQLWRRGSLLQHGSILIDPPAELWRELFGEMPPVLPPLPLVGVDLERHLRRSAELHLPFGGGGGAWVERQLEAAELAGIAPSLARYRVGPADTDPPAELLSSCRSTSPAATIDPAT
jgi:lipoate-protein ligase A